MSSDDKIQIIVDDKEQVVDFSDVMVDGAQKLRVSTPQSLMDTDFEYSVQPSKWEAITLSNNYPSFFAKPSGGNAFEITSITGDGVGPRSTITITTFLPHNLAAGQIVSVQETLNYLAEGTALITATPTPYQLQYVCRGTVSGDIQSGTLTTVYGGDIFDGAHIPGGSYPIGGTSTLNRWLATIDGASPVSTVTVTFDQPHGVFPGSQIAVWGTSSIDGNWYISQVATPYTFSFPISRQQSSVSVPATALIINKGDGYVIHRPYDGGVGLTTATNTMGAQIIRQTRRYFRYQSGKGIQFSTGAQLTPVYDIEYISLNGGSVGPATMRIQTVQDHGMQVGAKVTVEGIETNQVYNPYNITDTYISRVINTNTFEVDITLTSTVQTTDLTPAGTNIYVHVTYWDGSSTRAGLFDDQNGFFFEYDGAEVYVCRRHSEKEGEGRVTVTQYSSLVTGRNTQFRKQLNNGQSIVIKGTTYRVVQINSDTSMNVAPAYRGPSASGSRYLITQVERMAQDEWNIDQFDGEGPSGYLLDMKRMQMLYIDYTWYGAGTVRFGMRGNNGRIAWCHRIPLNNVNNGAYQRSGNLPARYEVANDPLYFSRMKAGGSAGVLGTALGPDDMVIWVEDTHDWPARGYLYVKDDKNVEIMQYTSIGSKDSVKQCAPIYLSNRRASITNIYPDVAQTYSGTKTRVTFTPDSSITGTGGNAQVSVQSITQNCAPMISHWGSSVIMDGRFDNDQNFVFTGGMTKYLSIPAGQARPLMAVRLAPSVDNAVAKNFGVRELVNRMQLQMSSMGVQTNGSFLIEGRLNPAKIEYTNYSAATLATTRSSVTGTSTTYALTVADTTGLVGIVPGMIVTGTGITNSPLPTVVSSVAGNRITISQPLTTTATGTYTFTPTTGFSGIPTDWTRDVVGSGSLAQVLYFDNCGPGAGAAQTVSGLVTGGDSVFSFYTENGSTTSFNSSTFDLRSIRDLGNSLQSGNGNVSTPGFPNGPDILVIQATNIGSASSQIGARISWTEAQA